MKNKIYIDIISGDYDLSREVFSLIASHYPKRYLCEYSSLKEYLSLNIESANRIVLLHDLEYLSNSNRSTIGTLSKKPKIYLVLMQSKPDYKLVSNAIKDGFEDFIYISENNDIVTSRLRLILLTFMRELNSQSDFKSENIPFSVVETMISAKVKGSVSFSRDIAKLAKWLLRSIDDGVSSGELDSLDKAARLYYANRLFLPDSKKDQLAVRDGLATSDQMNQLPHFSNLILDEAYDLKATKMILESVFENFDGSGFPAGKRSWEIPLPSRALKVASDFYENIRQGSSPKESLHLVEKSSNRLYDKRFTGVLHEYIQKYIDTEKNYPVETHLLELEPGMVTAKDVVTTTGLKLLPAGRKIDQHVIDLLVSHTKFDPIAGHIWISRDSV